MRKRFRDFNPSIEVEFIKGPDVLFATPHFILHVGKWTLEYVYRNGAKERDLGLIWFAGKMRIRKVQ
jgi:hypothetical protein